ncbi:MAG: Flp pilus assembly protein CpaB [Bacteriovoracia bacterium]
MNNRAFTISLALAGLAVFMIYSYITSKEEEYKARYGSETAVVVAKKDINEMDQINANMIEIISKPKKYIEPGYTNNKEEVEGYIASVPIRRGEQITLNKIMAPGVRTGLSRQITPGKRAISIAVSDLSAVGRLIKPGDRIDLAATIDPPGAQKGAQITKLILQDAPVLSVGEYISNQAPRKIEKDETSGRSIARNLNADRNFNTITIEVEPVMALQIVHMQSMSAHGITVMLRNNDDTERVQSTAVNVTDLLGSDVSRFTRGVATQR